MANKYYYDTGEEKLGPISGEELYVKLQRGEISPEVWVRMEDSETWRKLKDTDLREAEEAVRNPGLWKVLSQLLTSKGFLIVAAFLLVMMMAAGTLLYYLWPILPVLFLLIAFYYIVKGLNR